MFLSTWSRELHLILHTVIKMTPTSPMHLGMCLVCKSGLSSHVKDLINRSYMHRFGCYICLTSIKLMGYENLGDTFVFAGRSPKLERKLKDHIHAGRDLRRIGKNAVSRRYRGRFVLLCVSESEVIDKIKCCLTDGQRERIRNNREIPVLGYDEEGNEWKLKLREEKKIHSSYIFEREKTSRSEEKMDGISIWGFPYGGSGDDAPVPFVFTQY